MAETVPFPKRSEIMWLVVEALRELGVPATAQTVRLNVAEIGDFSQEQLSLPGPKTKRGTTTKLGDEVAWSLASLKMGGGVVRLSRRTHPPKWSLTPKAERLTREDMRLVLRASLRR